jgi:hypothetical protein
MKALEKDRARRYETASGLARDIQRYLDGDPVEAGPPSRVYRLRRFARKHRAALAIAAGFVVVLMVATAVSTWQAILARRQTTLARRAQTDALAQRSLALAAETKSTEERDAARKAKNHADEQAEITKVVNTFFLKDLLAQADVSHQDPSRGKVDPDIKIRTLLDRAAKSISEKFTGQPIVEAAIRQTIADNYRALGLYAEALPHAELATALRRHALGPEHPDTLVSQNQLALIYQEEHEPREAEALFLATLNVQRRVLGPEHPDTLAVQQNLAQAYLT